MLITPNFIFIHPQKTGGTFVREAIKQLLNPSKRYTFLYRLRKRLNVKVPLFQYRYEEFLSSKNGQHAWCNEIPDNVNNRPVISIIRNPYEFYVSAYTFGWWKKDLENKLIDDERDKFFDNRELALEEYPDLLNSNFEQFVESCFKFSRWTVNTRKVFPQTTTIGMATLKHIFFFCKDHEYIFEAAGDKGVFLSRIKEKHYDIHFLTQENLNQDLYSFLLSLGYPREDVKFVLKKSPINVSRVKKDFSIFYSTSLKKMIRASDSVLFDLFPQYDN